MLNNQATARVADGFEAGASSRGTRSAPQSGRPFTAASHRALRVALGLVSLLAALVGCTGHDEVDDTLPPIRTTTTATPFSGRASRFYEVKSGDTLTLIAATHQTTVDAIMTRNAIANPDDIGVGQVLELPPPSDPPTTG